MPRPQFLEPRHVRVRDDFSKPAKGAIDPPSIHFLFEEERARSRPNDETRGQEGQEILGHRDLTSPSEKKGAAPPLPRSAAVYCICRSV